jgi:hypothetical protein
MSLPKNVFAPLIGHSGPLLTATEDIDISEAAVLAKLVLS